MNIRDMPRIRFANLPTPLEEAQNLSRALNGPRIFFKRDDLTGSGLGGNKVRKLEFIIGRAVEEGHDTLIVCGGYQSNMARIASALGNKVGLNVELVLGGPPEDSKVRNGNLLLDYLLGANITYVDTVPRWEFGTALEDVSEALRRRGRKPFIVPLGGSSPEGMAGYVAATAELVEQLTAMSISPDRLFVAVGSGGTYSGLILGAANSSAGYEVVGISVSRDKRYLIDKIPDNINRGADLLGLKSMPGCESSSIYDDYIGDGYGALTDACKEAIGLVARTEGIFLDPVYSGKCMAGLIDLIRTGAIAKSETIVFLHTGGWPALFAYDTDVLPPVTAPGCP